MANIVQITKTLFRHTHLALKLMRHAAHLVVQVNAKIQSTTAPDSVKTPAAALAAQAESFLSALQAYKDSLG